MAVLRRRLFANEFPRGKTAILFCNSKRKTKRRLASFARRHPLSVPPSATNAYDSSTCLRRGKSRTVKFILCLIPLILHKHYMVFTFRFVCVKLCQSIVFFVSFPVLFVPWILWSFLIFVHCCHCKVLAVHYQR